MEKKPPWGGGNSSLVAPLSVKRKVTQDALGNDVAFPNISVCICMKVKSGVFLGICLHQWSVFCVAALPRTLVLYKKKFRKKKMNTTIAFCKHKY